MLTLLIVSTGGALPAFANELLKSAPAGGCGIAVSCAPSGTPGSTAPSAGGTATRAGPGTCGPAAAGNTCGSASDAASQTDQGGMDVGAGNPINLINGNKYQREADMPALPGVLGLEIIRHYNSVNATQGTTPGILGRGWALSYDTALYVVGNTIQIVQADGNRVTFNRNPNDPSSCAGTRPDTGTVHIRRTAMGEEFAWNWMNGRVLNFDHRGKLMQIVAPGGQFVSLQRDLAGLLLQVTDPQGRRLQLRYPIRGAGAGFRGVVAIDSPVGSFTYRYGSASTTTDAAPDARQAANLSAAIFPDGAAGRVYHFEDPLHPAFLTGISELRLTSVPQQSVQLRIATYLYDVQGRAILTVQGSPARLVTSADGRPVQPARLVEGTGIGQVTLDYTRPGVTIIANSLGQRTLYRHGILGGEYRLLEAIGPGCSQCGPTNIRYRWRADGMLTAITRLSEIHHTPASTEFHDYDRSGRLTAEWHQAYDERGIASGPRRLLRRFEYDEARFTPRAIVMPSVVAGAEHRIAIRYGDTELTRNLAVGIDETGFSPLVGGRTASGRISRSMAYAYDAHGARTEVDGPLPNAKANPGPANSDITRTERDPATGLVTRLIAPGNLVTQVVARDAALRPLLIRTSDGMTAHTIHFNRNWRGQPLTIRIDAAPLDDIAKPNAKAINPPDPFDSVMPGHQSRLLQYAYDPAGRLIGITLPGGLHTSLIRDMTGRLIRQVFPDGSTESITTDTEARLRQTELTSGTSAEGGTNVTASAPPVYGTTFDYDALGNPRSRTLANGTRRTMHADARGRLDETVDPLGVAMHIDYDAQDRPLRTIAAAGTSDAAETRMHYDSSGNLTYIIDPNGVTTRRWQDDFGRTTAEASPDRGIVLRRFDAAGRIIASIDDTGITTRITYDQTGRILTKGIDREPALVRYRYVGARLQDVTTLAEGTGRITQQTRYRYDAMGQIVHTREWMARVDGPADSQQAFPSRANSATTPLQGLQFDTVNEWNDIGKLVRQTLPDGHVLRYRYADNADASVETNDKAEIDARQRRDALAYASAGMNIVDSVPNSRSSATAIAGRLEALYFDDQIVVGNIRQDGIAGVLGYTHGNGIRREISLDATGRAARLTDSTPGTEPRSVDAAAIPGKAWPSGSAWFAETPVRSSVVYQQLSRHDAAGRLVMSQRQKPDPEMAARQMIDVEHYAYDRLNRLTRITTGKHDQTQLTYDRGGNRTSMRDTSGTQQYRYGTGTNRLIAVTGTEAGENNQMAISNRSRGALPDLPSAIPVSPQLRHGAQVSTVSASGTQRDVTTDQHSIVQSAWLFGSTGVPLLQFNLSRASDSLFSPAAPDVKIAARSGLGKSTDTQVGRSDDANSGEVRRTIYNTARRPIALMDTDGQPIAHYHYNVLGERIAKAVFAKGRRGNPTTTYSLYREQRLAAQADLNGHILAHFLYLDGKPIAKIVMQPAPNSLSKRWQSMPGLLFGGPEKAREPANTTGTIHAIHTDHLGTPQVVTDARREVVWQAHTAPFGQARSTKARKTVADASTFTMDLRLPGQVFDAETGLHYNYLRDYDPALGRYVTPDPIGLAGGLQPYGYVGNDPLNRTDQLGLYEEDVHYYMTFFLARTAGIGYQEARTIALATQYIDDNPETWPVDEKNKTANVNPLINAGALDRLSKYHFTTSSSDWYDPTIYDPLRTNFEIFYKSINTSEAMSYTTRRYKDPTNPQLTRLSNASSIAPSLCGKAQLFGEYLHAFEDTFGHRDQLNAPIKLNEGLGHGAYGHSPDKTYNHKVTLVDLASRPFDLEMATVLELGSWDQNEARAYQMEFEVYIKLRQLHATVGKNELTEKPILFKQFSDFLEDWNKIQTTSEKITALSFKLDDLGLGALPEYSKDCAAAKRNEYIGSLDSSKFPGVILPSKKDNSASVKQKC